MFYLIAACAAAVCLLIGYKHVSMRHMGSTASSASAGFARIMIGFYWFAAGFAILVGVFAAASSLPAAALAGIAAATAGFFGWMGRRGIRDGSITFVQLHAPIDESSEP